MPPPQSPPAMTAEELARIGEERYGYGWRSALSRELPASLRSVMHWSRHGVPKPAVARAIRALATEPVDPSAVRKAGGDRKSAEARSIRPTE